MSAHDEAAAIIANPGFAADPAGTIASVVGRAADAHRMVRRQGPAQASRLTHVAALLVAEADNPAIPRGAILDALVREYGEPTA